MLSAPGTAEAAQALYQRGADAVGEQVWVSALSLLQFLALTKYENLAPAFG